MNRKPAALITLLVIVLTPASRLHAEDWKHTLRSELPLLGHRNWIVVADSAYPWQVSPGVQTVETGSDQLTVIREVVNQLSKTRHVRPVILTDSELPFVPEKDAPGITAYRAALGELLRNQTAQSLPHEQIIAKLDEAGRTFHVLLLKTIHTQPYTSLFLQLQCGYWSPEAEKDLRATMARSKTR